MTVIIDDNEEIINNIKDIYKTYSSAKVRNLIEKHFTPTNEEKKKYAEVATPVFLVDEMLSKIPTDFWETPKKVFEPCCGKGNFILGIFDKFYKGLEYITDEAERCRIIVEECIYYADISPLNIFITTELLKCHIKSYVGETSEIDNIDFKSHTGDTLTLDVNSYWNIEEGFDAVIGNPPYQNSNNNKGIGNTLWNLFVDKSLNYLLIEKGLLLYVHPRGWRQINSKIGSFMKSKQIVYMNINSVNKGLEIFKCATDYDYYLIENIDVYKETVINDYENKEYQYMINKDLKFIPNHNLNEVYSLIDIVDDNGFMCSKSLYETRRKWMSNIKTDEYQYPCVYSINSKNDVSKKWSKRNDNGHFGITKFIFSNGKGSYKDFDGEYGLTEWAYAIKCNKQDMNNVEIAYNSNKFNRIIDAIKLTSNKYNYNVIKLFKKDFWKEFIDEE
jgi:hypothetical protein